MGSVKRGGRVASYVSSNAFVWRNVMIGENCFVLEGSGLHYCTKIGNNVTGWPANFVGYKTVVKDNCFISSHAAVSGFCEIGEN